MFSLLRLFRRPDYHSEVSQFIDQLKTTRPGLEQRQLAGRALLWDKQVDRSQQAQWQAQRVPQKAYVYGSGEP